MALDTGGNVQVDFVWGNYPMQPNDIRTETAAVNIGGTTGSNLEAFQSAVVTAASGNGTTVTYTSANAFNVGQKVTITGLATAALNLSNVFIATLVGTEGARTGFTVTNAANAGEVTGQRGKVEATNALTAYDGAGIGFINVPSVVGDTLAVALDELKDAGYETANITTASAATNLRTSITRFNATSTTAATIYATSANTNYPVGTKVTIVAGTPAASAPVNPPAYAVGTFTVTAVASGQITVSGTGFTVADTTGINSTLNLAGLEATIKSQTVAAGTASVLSTATISVTPYAAATVS